MRMEARDTERALKETARKEAAGRTRLTRAKEDLRPYIGNWGIGVGKTRVSYGWFILSTLAGQGRR